MTERNIRREPIIEYSPDGRPVMHRWPIPADPETLRTFLTDIFQRYWDQIIFGPSIDGAAYEWTCPCAPDCIELEGEFLTIGFNGPHFHLCIGTNRPSGGDQVREARMRELRPASASIYRCLDMQGAPNGWGFEMHNSAGTSMLSIHFANPFVLPGDRLAENPDWSRLAMWRDISSRYLGREPEAFDETSRGFDLVMTA